MSTQILLLDLEKRGIKLRVEGENLKFKAPSGAFDEGLKAKVKAQKGELIELLSKAPSPVPSLRTNEIQEIFEERAAIREYEGGQERMDAEASAMGDVLESFELEDRESLLEVFRTLLKWSKAA